MDLEALLNDISEDAPSGENLEYDPDFTALLLAAEIKEEQQIGDEVVEATPPDYNDIRDKASALLERSHDLRVAMHLAMAELSTGGFSGFGEALTYARRLLQDRWETCHPQLDADDDNDPTMRVNAMMALVDQVGILRAVRRAPLTESRGFGRFSFRDIEFATGARALPADMDAAPELSMIAAAFQDTDSEALSGLHATVATIREDVNAIDDVFSEQIPGQGPDLDPLKSLLTELHRKLGEYVGGEAGEAAEAEGDDQMAPVAQLGGGAQASFSGGVNSPDDVLKALDQILSYYARSEPSSPLPILLERAKRLVRADFLTIMRDIAPDGVTNVRLVGGLPEESEY